MMIIPTFSQFILFLNFIRSLVVRGVTLNSHLPKHTVKHAYTQSPPPPPPSTYMFVVAQKKILVEMDENLSFLSNISS